MTSDRPCFLAVFLCLVISVSGEDEFTDLIAQESGGQTNIPEIVSSSKEAEAIGDTGTSLGAQIQPTTASSLGGGSGEELSSSSYEHHGKPTMTVTAIRLGTSRYFHPASFDPLKDEQNPHSVIFPEGGGSTPSPTSGLGESETATPGNGGSGFIRQEEASPETTRPLPSFDFDNEFPTLASFEYYPEQRGQPTKSEPLKGIFAGGTLLDENSSGERKVGAVSSEESPSTEGSEISSEVSPTQITASKVKLPEDNSTSMILDNWPSYLVNDTADLQSIELTTPPSIPLVLKSDKPSSSNEDYEELTTFSEEGNNELPEPLPKPVALIADSSKEPASKLQDDFAEALRKVEPRPRQRRPSPGRSRRVRMRVRKLNGPRFNPERADNVKAAGSSFTAVSTEAGATKPPPRTRYRSTTTTSSPIPDPSPPTVPTTKFEFITRPPWDGSRKVGNTIVRSGPMPLLLKSPGSLSLASKREPQGEKLSLAAQELSPQIEKPTNAGFTEKVNAFFHPPNPTTSSRASEKSKPNFDGDFKKLNESGDGEWLHYANSKHHDVQHHADEAGYFQDRDNWEKNYMNLQQNSFYGASAETIEQPPGGQTLTELNRAGESSRINEVRGERGVMEELAPLGHTNAVINIPQHQNVASVTFRPPKIVFVEPRGVKDAPPEMNIIERPPEQQQYLEIPAGGTEVTREEFMSHLERPLINLHSQEEEYIAMDHPDLTGPRSSNSEPQFQTEGLSGDSSHYDRTKYEYVDPSEYIVGSQVAEASTPKPLLILTMGGGPEYSQFQLGDDPSRPGNQPPQQPLPPQQFTSQEFLGFGNEKHLVMPELLSSNRLQKSTDFDKISKSHKNLGSDASGFLHSGGNGDALPEGFQYHPAPYQNYNLPNSAPTQKTLTSSGGQQSFLPFPSKEYSRGPVREVPPPRVSSLDARQLAYSQYPDTSYTSSKMYGNGAPGLKTSGSGPKDSYKSPDFSNSYASSGKYPRLPGVSPTITLPMPGLVSVPTPPPDGMQEVMPNRHFPPHTHSMASRPDYEPANPPLPNGHPLQHHFDPFVQNTGDFPDDAHKQQQGGGGQHLNSDFKDLGGPAEGSFSGASQSGIPYYPYPQSQPYHPGSQESSSPYGFDGQGNSPNLPPFKPSQIIPEGLHDGKFGRYPSPSPSLFDQGQGGNGDGGGGSLSDHYASNPNTQGDVNPSTGSETNYLDHEGESQETQKEGYEAKQQQQQQQQQEQSATTPSPYSDTPYVLMFSNNIPQTSIPVPQKLPSSNADPSLALGSEMKNSLGLGYHAVPVHPRDQMLQVLASSHYENMLEEYREKKKKPPSSIYTPYGVLVPVGPTAGAASTISEGHAVGHGEHGSQGGHSHGHPGLKGRGLAFTLKSPILNTQKHLEYDKGRITGNFGLKATVEPALELLAEKVAQKLNALEYILKHPPKHIGFHLGADPPQKQHIPPVQHHHNLHEGGHEHSTGGHEHSTGGHEHQSGGYQSEHQSGGQQHHGGHSSPHNTGSGQQYHGGGHSSPHNSGGQQYHGGGHGSPHNSGGSHHYQGGSYHHANEGSYSELKPTQVEPGKKPTNPKTKSLSSPSKLSSKSNNLVSEKESNESFKKYIKALLKERLQEMLVEMDESASEVRIHKTLFPKEKQPMPTKPLPAPKPWNPEGDEGRGKEIKYFPHPNLLHMGLPATRKPAESGGGFLQSIKRFFSFGRQTQPTAAEATLLMKANHIPNFNFSRKLPPLSSFDYDFGDQLASTNTLTRTNKKVKMGGMKSGENEKLNARDVEKILSILLKSGSGELLGSREAGFADRVMELAEEEATQGLPRLKGRRPKKFGGEGSDGYEPMMSGSSNRPMAIRMVAPPRHSSLDKHRRNFLNSKIDKGHWRMPRSFSKINKKNIKPFKKIPK